MKLPSSFGLFLTLIVFVACCNLDTISPASKSTLSQLSCHLSLAPKQLEKDFNILTTTLKGIHPNLYRISSKEHLNHRIQSIQQQFNDSLSYLEFLKLIAPFLTDIGCINTQWGHSKEYIQFRNTSTPIFPLLFRIKNQQFFITKNYSNDSSVTIGDEIQAINGISSSDYLQKNYPLLPIDGKIKTLQNRWLESYFPQHHSNFWEQVDTFNLELIDKEGNYYVKKVAALKRGEFKKSEREQEKPLQFKSIDSIAVLTVKTFNPNRIEYFKQNYSTFLDSCFKLIKENKPKLLLLDLRGNSWGKMHLAKELYSYFSSEPFHYTKVVKPNKPFKLSYDSLVTALEQLDSSTINELEKINHPKPNQFNGKIYVITNG